MADNDMSGIERLREAAEKTQRRIACTGTALGAGREECLEKDCYDCVGDQLIKIADRIERERNDIIKRHAVALANAEARVADLERNMTGEAREVVERLRAVEPNRYDGETAYCYLKTIVDVAEAVGCGKHEGTAQLVIAMRDRLCDLIEHGGKQDVDVEALRKLLRDIDDTVKNDSACQYFDKQGKSCDGCPAYDEDCYRAVITDIAERISKAIGGAPEQRTDGTDFDAFKHLGTLGCVEDINAGLAAAFAKSKEREAAADWVEAQGGLDAVRDRMAALDDFISDVAEKVGVPIDEKGPITIYGDVMAELDKRLMPEGMEWPRDHEGNRFEFGDEFNHVEGCSNAPVEGFEFFADHGAMFQQGGIRQPFGYGQRVKRPAPAVLGADGKPIAEGETVYGLSDGKAWRVETIGFGSHCVLGESNDGTERDLRPEWLTHTPPDTQERIDEDKRKSLYLYWGCKNAECISCPASIGGEKPCRHYKARDCSVAQGMDIARREQELKDRTAGGAR